MFGKCGNCIVEPHEKMVCIIYPYMEHQMSDNIGLSAFVCRTQANPGLSCVYLADHLIAGASRRSFPRGPSRNVPGQVISLDSMQDRKPSSCRRLQPWFVFRWFLPAPCHVATCRPAIRFNLRTSRVRVGVTTNPTGLYMSVYYLSELRPTGIARAAGGWWWPDLWLPVGSEC
jgi:hypothetical protein